MNSRITLPTLVLLLLALTACGGENTASNVKAPGEAESTKTEVLEKGAEALQNKPPVEALNAYLDGFHFYNGNMRGQMEAHHYCSVLNEDVIQCVIYDGNVAQAKLMGVEYIVSEKLFKDLPAQEKALWHSHVHEVKSGQLIAPGIPEVAEKELMKKLIGTYGKTWHLVSQARKRRRAEQTFPHPPSILAPMPGRRKTSCKSKIRRELSTRALTELKPTPPVLSDPNLLNSLDPTFLLGKRPDISKSG